MAINPKNTSKFEIYQVVPSFVTSQIQTNTNTNINTKIHKKNREKSLKLAYNVYKQRN